MGSGLNKNTSKLNHQRWYSCIWTPKNDHKIMKKKGIFVVNKQFGSPLSLDQQNLEKLDVNLEEALDIADCLGSNNVKKDLMIGIQILQKLENVFSKTEVEFRHKISSYTGAGKYQLIHCALMLTVLTSALLEIIGPAFVLPAAICDLDIPDNLRGVITCVPNIGIILTATLWGRAADFLGRKPSLVVCTASAGVLATLAAFMPNLLSFTLCKLAASLFLSCPSSLSFAFGGELMPLRRRDFAVLILSAMLMVMSTLSPVLAWLILPHDWDLSLGFITLRPWRLLTIVYALPLLLSAALLPFAKESPKFLVTRGKYDEALEVLKCVYARNTGKPKENYSVSSLKKPAVDEVDEGGSALELTVHRRQDSALDLLRGPHLKWTALTGFLMFGVFCLLNGLFLFAPDTINKVMSGSSEESGTICLLMNQSLNQTTNSTCIDTISTNTFSIMAVTTFVYAMVVLVASVCPLSKKTLLVSTFLVVGAACLMSGLMRQRMVAGVAMSALQLTALGIGPLTAYAVDLFPTTLRGTAVGALLMFGRMGSVVGSNIAGVSLAAACSATFYGFSTLLFVCAALSFALPNQASSDEEVSSNNTTS